jgi:hypothetical protein
MFPEPLYLVYPGGQIHPLPAPPQDGQWNFGYSGGGPGALADAIERLFAQADHIGSDAFPHHWVEDQVETSPDAELRISVDELRRRYP